MYQKIDNQIHGIIFTMREIDIIACIMNIHGRKKIADILDISPRTVEVHIKNILVKIDGSSQDAIKDFVGRSDKLALIQQHYINLLLKKLFLVQLTKIASQLQYREILCQVQCEDIKFLEKIIHYLKLAKIKISNITDVHDAHKQFTVVVLTEKHLLELTSGKSLNNRIFICFNKGLRDKFLERFTKINIIDCFASNQIYSAILRIIQLLVPDINLNRDFENFNKQSKQIINLKIALSYEELQENKKLGKKTLNNTRIIIGILIFALSIGIIFAMFTHKRDVSTAMSINFFLPDQKVLLSRRMIDKQLDNILSRTDGINTAVLLGMGGAGKSTIARQYGKSHKASIIWEINAETKHSILSSFESLAYALCNNNNDRQELRNIFNIKDSIKQEKQLLLFTQQQLKQLERWIIIYDNVELLNDILDYIPLSHECWGKGKIIITTRNGNIVNNDFIDEDNIINIGEISTAEKIELFSKTIGDSAVMHIDDPRVIEQFLSQIPSFPLDVTTAAHYIKSTNIGFDEYLEEIGRSKVEFTELQESILDEARQYSKTRYSIIKLSLHEILKSNAEFKELALLISILDSQEIPEKLLFLSKDKYITNHFIQNLQRQSFITDSSFQEQDNIKSFSIHRSIQNNILVEMVNSLSIGAKEEYIKNILHNIQSYILHQIDIEHTQCLKNLLRHCKALLSKEHLQLSSMSITSLKSNLGIINYYLGQDQEARAILEDNLSLNNSLEDRALILTHLGAIYRKLGQDYEKAISYLQEAITIYESSLIADIRIGLALTHLGNTHRTLGNLSEAIKILEKSIDIYHKYDVVSVGEIRALGYLGVAYRESGDLMQAVECLEEARKQYEYLKYPQYNSVYAGTLAHLAITYRMMGQYHKAKELLEKSIEIYKNIRPTDHPDIGRNVVNLGIIYGELQDNKKAQELLEKSLRDYECNYGKPHIETGKVLNHLGRVYILSKEHKKAEEVLTKAINILVQNAHPESYRSYELMGDLKMLLSDYKAAMNDYHRALELAEKYFSKESMHIIRIKDKIYNITQN